MSKTALKGIQCESELSKLFFSDQNFKRLQRMIKEEVFKRSNGEFKLDLDQEQRDLFIAMNAIYKDFGRFLPNQVVRQVKQLNKKVIDEVVPGMLTEIRQYHGYKNVQAGLIYLLVSKLMRQHIQIAGKS